MGWAGSWAIGRTPPPPRPTTVHAWRPPRAAHSQTHGTYRKPLLHGGAFSRCPCLVVARTLPPCRDRVSPPPPWCVGAWVRWWVAERTKRGKSVGAGAGEGAGSRELATLGWAGHVPEGPGQKTCSTLHMGTTGFPTLPACPILVVRTRAMELNWPGAESGPCKPICMAVRYAGQLRMRGSLSCMYVRPPSLLDCCATRWGAAGCCLLPAARIGSPDSVDVAPRDLPPPSSCLGRS